jgi:hypothetical protein
MTVDPDGIKAAACWGVMILGIITPPFEFVICVFALILLNFSETGSRRGDYQSPAV